MSDQRALHIAVIGAGPAGMTAALELAENGVEVEVFEAGPAVGGLSKSIDLWNQRIDIGPHRFFSDDTRVNKLWLKVVGRDYSMVNRLTRIYYKNKFFYYPIKPFDALRKLGVFTAAACLFSYLAAKFTPGIDTSTFEGWTSRRFGKKLFRIFFKTYTEKLWGIPCNELDADFAAQRIKKLSLWEALKNGLLGGRGNQHKTLVDQFAYPLGGTGMVYERMSEMIQKQGGKVHLNTAVKGIITEKNQVKGIQLMSGETRDFSAVISTMPISSMVRSLAQAPEEIKEKAGKLTFRNTIIVYLRIGRKHVFSDNWLYVHSSELKMGRITNFSNWVPEINRGEVDTILALEYWCYEQDEFWNYSDHELIELGRKEIIQTGLVTPETVKDGYVYRIPKCYPVYARAYKENLKPVETYLSTIEGLQVIGRYGAFKYNNQDHSILMGILAADNILNNTQQNLWEINTDYDEYQEKSVITKTGLTES